eukprot:COSAG04_NODE_2311_length_4348_cov_2.486703_6_plen_109_part_00
MQAVAAVDRDVAPEPGLRRLRVGDAICSAGRRRCQRQTDGGGGGREGKDCSQVCLEMPSPGRWAAARWAAAPARSTRRAGVALYPWPPIPPSEPRRQGEGSGEKKFFS